MYGIEAEKTLISGRKIEIIIFRNLSIDNELIILKKNDGKKEKINLNVLTDISFGNKRGNFIKNKINCSNKKIIYNSSNCISLFKSKAESYDLLFPSEKLLNLFSLGLLQILKNGFDDDNDLKNYFNKPIKKLWNLYDNDRSNKLELSEFSKLIKQMNMDFSKFSLNIKNEKSIKRIFEKIDKDNSGKIDYQEFLLFFNLVNSGSEYSEIFNIYSKEKDYLTLDDFQNFLIKEQKQIDIKKSEVNEIMLRYKFNVAETDITTEKNYLR